MKKYKVVIVDDHEVFRNGLKLLLGKINIVSIAGEASNGKEFLELLKNKQIDIVFMDINMPVLDGIAATEEALKMHPDLKIIALTAFGDTEFFDKMIYAGVEGYMLKNSTLEDFRKAIAKIILGGNYFSDELLVNFTKEKLSVRIEKEKIKLPSLSERELDVLKLICKGYSNEKIGELLFISPRTVERHKTNLLEKTGAVNTVNLVIYAFKNKLVEIE